jgi:hypothetical protein
MTKSNSNCRPKIVADGVIELKGKHYGLIKDCGWYDLDPLGKKVRDDSDLAIILSNCYAKTTVQNLQETLEQSGWQGPTAGKVAILDDELYVKYKEEWYHLIPRPEEHRRLKETDDFYYCKLDGEMVRDYDNLHLTLLNLYEIYKHTKVEAINAGREAAKKAIGRGALLWAAGDYINKLTDPTRAYDPQKPYAKVIVLKKK